MMVFLVSCNIFPAFLSGNSLELRIIILSTRYSTELIGKFRWLEMKDGSGTKNTSGS